MKNNNNELLKLIIILGTVPLYKATIPYHDKNSILVMKAKNRLPDSKQLLVGYK